MITVRRIDLIATAFLVLVIGIVIGCFWQANEPETPAVNQFPTTPCVTEDSRDCYWDATIRGNGEGRSFWDIGGEVVYK